ncbi:hypothetical protein PRIPAC_74280 [Pristionchus pacificus]|uniref:Uncharacterized protein n=1 Tax=Pristionchus pacificus TaxID=54126 RepID=A0A2A6BES3_PRIPA|nr:hypothetical protein PRIPAC_74280 [Pristionchus pacificus]|eukprot:PDM64400.1 hypothetical protein PRIPAC_52656 [Pristionchus pacificus]
MPKNNTKKATKDNQKSIFVDPTSDKTKGISARDFPPELGLNGSTRRVLRSSRKGEEPLMPLPDDLPLITRTFKDEPTATSTPRRDAYKKRPVANPIDGASNAIATPASSNPTAAAEAQPSAVRISTNPAAKANGEPTVVTAAPVAAKAQPSAANATNAASKANAAPVVVNPTAANTTGTMGTGARFNGPASGRNLAAPRVDGAATAAPTAVPANAAAAAAVRRPAQPHRPVMMERVTGVNVASEPLTTITTTLANSFYDLALQVQQSKVDINQMKLDLMKNLKKVPIKERLQLCMDVIEGAQPAKPAADVIEGPQPAIPAAVTRKRPATADAASPDIVVVKRERP